MSVPPLKKRELERFLKKYPNWKCNKRSTKLERVYEQPDYVSGLVFVARITVHAELQNHHPEVTLSYGKVKVSLQTHEIKSLSQKDVVLAGKIELLSQKN